jgi:LPPG:FO 2-phospho-L-lactate transferase
MRDLIKHAKAPVVAISPVVGGVSLKGPTDRMLADLGMQVSAAQVARLYAGIADVFILDVRDEAAKPEIENLGLKVYVTDTVMSGLEAKIKLAAFTLESSS